MTKAAKVENYSAELTAQITEAWNGGNGKTVAAIAEMAGKSTRSIVAKLSRLGVYKKKAYVAKDGTKAESKADIVAEIAKLIGADSEAVGSLETATKETLKMVRTALQAGADDGEF